MKITDDQIILLNKFKCERLHKIYDNESAAVLDFECKKNRNLEENLKFEAFKQDIEGQIAYYVVTLPDDKDIFMYFSLKCGSLFIPFASEKDLNDKMQEINISLRLISMLQSNNDNERKIANTLLQHKFGLNTSSNDFVDLIRKKISKNDFLIELVESLNEDKSIESNKKINRVQNTYPAIELVHFCKNDKISEQWKSFNIFKPMCEVFFWFFIAPILFKIQKLVGCEYVFLFAADISQDRTLINYYHDSLNFVEQSEIGTNKPFYDFNCCFMCQRISDLKINQMEYFNNFNPEGEII